MARKRCGVSRPDCSESGERDDALSDLRPLAEGIHLDRTLALVGMMGAGKTTVGRKLAAALHMPFVDADMEIERAAGLSIAEIFARHGEPEFRRGERSVIARLLADPPHVLATGGGAFMDPVTRAAMREKAVTVWIKAPLDVLLRRVERREHRPLLKSGDPADVLTQLMETRYPVYAEADIVIESNNGPHTGAVAAVLEALKHYTAKAPA